MKIKDFYLELLSENKDFFYLDGQSVGKVNDVNINKKDDYIKIDFETTYGKPLNLVTKYGNFKSWYRNNIDKFSDVFTEADSNINEIIDDDGNIMASTDEPANTTNSMVGANNNWDLEKLYKSSIPKSIRFFSGDLGVGIVSW